MDDIIIVDYDPAWPTQFVEEAARLRAALGDDLVVTVEHFGSTAVPGLSAKPIIDLLVAVRSLADMRQRGTSALEALGYAYWSDDPAPDRMFFVKGLPPGGPRTHHVHVVEPGVSRDPRMGEFTFADRLLFRDRLRADPEEAQRYEALKRELAAQFPDDREGYTNGKTDYIYGVMQKARNAPQPPIMGEQESLAAVLSGSPIIGG